MKPASALAKKLVEDTFSKQKLLVHLGSKIIRVNHG